MKKLLCFLLCFLLCSGAFGQLPDAPQPQPDATHRPTVPFPSAPHHTWVRRHALAIELIGLGATAGFVLYKTWPHRCPSMVDGFPYDGYGSGCPSWCDKDGCYWGPGGHRVR